MPSSISSTSSTSSALDSPIDLQAKYYRAISTNLKTIEGRLNRGRYTQFSTGQTISFIDNDHVLPPLPCRITSVTKYGSFREMLESVGVEACLPGVMSVEEGVGIYWGFEGYREGEGRWGVLAIGVEVVRG